MWQRIKRSRKFIILVVFSGILVWKFITIANIFSSKDGLFSEYSPVKGGSRETISFFKSDNNIYTYKNVSLQSQRDGYYNDRRETVGLPSTLGLRLLSKDADCSVVSLQSSDKPCMPFWQRALNLATSRNDSGERKPYYVSELLHVRIYPKFDKAKWTIKELKQWIHFLLLAGVEHIYICNHFIYEDEIIGPFLQRYIDLNLVTCIPWNIGKPWSTEDQIDCYKHFIKTNRQRSRWHIDVDMDEYPWSPTDNKERFLIRYIQNMELRHGDQLTEISMDNFLMMGQGNRSEDMTVARINRMIPKPENQLVKPIFRPDRVDPAMHMNHILIGHATKANPGELRLLHYWGARTQNWGPDTDETRNRTVIMNSFKDAWANQLRNSLLAFGETDVFNSSTGP